MTATMKVVAEPQAAPAEEAAKKKRSLKPLLIVLGALLLAGAAYMLVLKPMLFPPHYKPGQPVPVGQIVTLPSNTINLADGHLVQVTVAIQLTAPAVATKIDEDQPKFLNAEINTFGTVTYGQVLTAPVRQMVRQTLLHDFQQIAGTSEGAQQVSAVYFTSFIAQ